VFNWGCGPGGGCCITCIFALDEIPLQRSAGLALIVVHVLQCTMAVMNWVDGRRRSVFADEN